MPLQFKLKSTLKGHTSAVRCLTQDDNNLWVFGSDEPTIKLWNEKGKCISTFKANYSVRCLTVFKDMIISGDYNGIIQYWNSSTGKCIKSIQVYNGFPITSLVAIKNLLYSGSHHNIMAWTEDGECGFGGDDRNILTYTQEDLQCIRILQAHSKDISCLIGFKGMLISGSKDETIKCWSLSSPYDCITTLKGHSNYVNCLAVCGNYLLSGSDDKTMKLWDVIEGCIRTFQQDYYVMSILVVDTFIINGDSDGKIHIWSIEGSLLESVDAHFYSVTSLVKYRNHIYSCSYDRTVKKWSFSYLKTKKAVNI